MHGTRIASAISRRDFIITAASIAGGLLVGIGVAPGGAAASTISTQPWADNEYPPHELDAWIAIDPDDSILIRYQRSEMGQGSMTALPMMITEELQCDWSKVRIEYASATRSVQENRVYGNMYSHGSMSVRESQKLMQQVGASARERLIAAAAARWKVSTPECVAALSVVTLAGACAAATGCGMAHRGLAAAGLARLLEHLGNEALALALAPVLRGAGAYPEIVVAAVGHGCAPCKLWRVRSCEARGHACIGAGLAPHAARRRQAQGWCGPQA